MPQTEENVNKNGATLIKRPGYLRCRPLMMILREGTSVKCK
jgi:hypothetical protein